MSPVSEPGSTLGARLCELALVFLRLGTLGFGGLVVQIAMMEEEAVTRHRWLERSAFLDLVGASNLIPGPNAVKVALLLGHARAGWPGYLVAGWCFAGPAVLLSGALAWGYLHFGALPQVAALLLGIKPAILAVIVVTVWNLGWTAVKTWRLGLIGAVTIAAVLLGVRELTVLILGVVLGTFWLHGSAAFRPSGPAVPPLRAWLPLPLVLWRVRLSEPLAALIQPLSSVPPTLIAIGWFFLKVGAALFGNGYVLVAFLGDLVHEYHWLSQQQLVDAIAVGQVTPGPLLSTATFIGYLLADIPGAAVATAAIFLPSFLAAALLTAILPRLRRSDWSRAFLDVVNVCSVALLAAVAFQLLRATLTDGRAWTIALVATLVSLRWKVNPSWLVLGGGAVGVLFWALGL